jgi:hypothetical protein
MHERRSTNLKKSPHGPQQLTPEEVSLAQLAMGVDVQLRHPGSNPRGYEFGFLLFIKKTRYGGLPHRFPFKKNN